MAACSDRTGNNRSLVPATHHHRHLVQIIVTDIDQKIDRVVQFLPHEATEARVPRRRRRVERVLLGDRVLEVELQQALRPDIDVAMEQRLDLLQLQLDLSAGSDRDDADNG